jgi:hypothetical protein
MLLTVLLNGEVTATFAGTPEYFPSADSAGLIE